jgi:gluconate 2-dehydrogenase subunit 3-like protein
MGNNPDTAKPIPLHPVGDPSTALSRRVALQVLVGSVGAGFALPGTAGAQHPVHQHLSSAATLEQAQQRATVAGYTPEFLDPHQLTTLETMAESLVPGSTAARVAPYLDQLIAVESPANQRDFVGALGAFDMAAVKKHGKVWVAISPAEQDALLRQSSTEDAKTSAMRTHFDNLKTWIAGAYYSSEVGMRELGWDGNVFHQELPACTHPDGHVA